MKLSRTIFWDVNYDTIDWEKHARFVMERVLMRGTLEDVKQLKSYYGLEKIKEEIIQSRYLDRVTLNFCSVFLGIPKEEFRCYIPKQSNPTPWNY